MKKSLNVHGCHPNFATSCAKSSQVADVPVDDLASVVIDSIEFPHNSKKSQTVSE